MAGSRRVRECPGRDDETADSAARGHLCDLIEEYGRHTGHADLVREAIDGKVGEDMPADWSPTP